MFGGDTLTAFILKIVFFSIDLNRLKLGGLTRLVFFRPTLEFTAAVMLIRKTIEVEGNEIW